ERVNADIAHATRRPRARGVGAPFGLLVAGPLDRLGQPALVVLDDDFPHLAELARRDARFRFRDHRVGGIGMREAVQKPGTLYLRAQGKTLGEARRGRLVRKDVEAVAQRASATGRCRWFGVTI